MSDKKLTKLEQKVLQKYFKGRKYEDLNWGEKRDFFEFVNLAIHFKDRRKARRIEEEKLKFGDIKVLIPDEMVIKNKKGKEQDVKTVTKKGNLTTRQGKKSIIIKTHKSGKIKLDNGKQNDKNKIVFNTASITIPDTLNYNDKKKKLKSKNSLTKKGNVATVKKKKAVTFSDSKYNDKIKIEYRPPENKGRQYAAFQTSDISTGRNINAPLPY